MSNCLLIIFVIGSCVTFRGFLSKFSKCCFYKCIHSSWLVAFSLAFAVLFFLLTSFTVCHAILDCLSSKYSYCNRNHFFYAGFCIYIFVVHLAACQFAFIYPLHPPSSQVRCDSWLIFKLILNSEFSILNDGHTKAKELCLPYYSPIVKREKMDSCLSQSETLTALCCHFMVNKFIKKVL